MILACIQKYGEEKIVNPAIDMALDCCFKGVRSTEQEKYFKHYM